MKLSQAVSLHTPIQINYQTHLILPQLPPHSIVYLLVSNYPIQILFVVAYKLIEVCCDLLNIQIMSKKPQPQTKENPKNRPQIVDQQNEPFLKTLQKKVRNINKKLTEITELEAKESLKPEQVEKVNRKVALLEERARVEETATLFKESYVENAAVYRSQQLKELEVLSRAIAIFHAGAKLPESEKLANLWHALEQSEHYSTLNEAITSLGNSLKDFANDPKLQKALSAYVGEHGNSKITPIVSNEEKIVSDILEEKAQKVETKPEPVPVQIPAPVVPVPEPTPVVAPAVVAVPEPEPVKVEALVTEKREETPVVAVEAVATPLTEAIQPVKTEEKPTEQPKEYKKRNYGNRENRDNRDNRDNRENRGGYKRREGEEPREKRQYKPKYADKEPVAQKQQDESDSSDSELEARNFRKDEIKQLEDDGFIVTKAKPKPKAKDQREQRQAYENQHGRKPQANGQK